jgi:hypothetical protein
MIHENKGELTPDYIRRMRDPLGFHRIKVYRDERILKHIIKYRIEAREKYREDSIYLVGGLEGKGKSNLILLSAHLYGEATGTPVPIENVTRDIDELLQRLNFLQRKEFVAMDEGSELSGERFNEKKSRDIKNKFTVMREPCFIIFMAYTNPMKMNTYFREDRVRGVFFMKKPGIVWFYANSNENPHFTNLLNNWERVNKTKSTKLLGNYAPDFIMNFKEYKGELRKAYDKRKDDHISRVLNSAGGKAPVEEEVAKTEDEMIIKDSRTIMPDGSIWIMSVEAVRIYGYTYSILNKLVGLRKIRFIGHGRVMRYNLDDLKKNAPYQEDLQSLKEKIVVSTHPTKGRVKKKK